MSTDNKPGDSGKRWDSGMREDAEVLGCICCADGDMYAEIVKRDASLIRRS